MHFARQTQTQLAASASPGTSLSHPVNTEQLHTRQHTSTAARQPRGSSARGRHASQPAECPLRIASVFGSGFPVRDTQAPASSQSGPHSGASSSRSRKQRVVENPNMSLLRPLKLGILLAGGCRGTQHQLDRRDMGLAQTQSKWLRPGVSASELPRFAGVLPHWLHSSTVSRMPLRRSKVSPPGAAENINPFIF